MPIFTFPDEPSWNEERRAVQFTVEIGEYSGIVSIPRTLFQSFVPAPSEQTCLEAFYRHRAQFERIVEMKIAARQLTDDGHIMLNAKDLRLAGVY